MKLKLQNGDNLMSESSVGIAFGANERIYTKTRQQMDQKSW